MHILFLTIIKKRAKRFVKVKTVFSVNSIVQSHNKVDSVIIAKIFRA